MSDHDDDVPFESSAGVTFTGSVKEKLVRTKEAWADSGRGLTDQSADPTKARLPPGQHVVKDWPVLDLGVVPNVPQKDWSLTVAGAVRNRLTWTFEDLMAQPQMRSTSDIHCVTTWSRYDNTWEGVSFQHLLNAMDPLPEAQAVMLKGYDGYTTNVPLSWLKDETVLLAHSWEGEPLSREHGGPVRMVIPKLYFWKSAKWLRHITVMDKDAPGYWEARGYHMLGRPFDEERYGG